MSLRKHAGIHRRLFLQGIFVSTSIQADAGAPAQPMRGPDFVLAHVASWSGLPAQGMALLVLRDGTRWQLDSRRSDSRIQARFIEDALRLGRELLVSGDRQAGLIERTAASRKLAVQRLDEARPDGRCSVLFYGPPSIYYLRMERAGATADLELLRRSAAGGGFMDRPDLLVGIDTVFSDIVAVRTL